MTFQVAGTDASIPGGDTDPDGSAAAFMPAQVAPAPDEPVPCARFKPTAKPRVAVPLSVMAMVAWLSDVAILGAVGLSLDAVSMGGQIERLLPFALICYTGVARGAGAYDADGLFYVKRSWPRVANAWLCAMLSIAALSYGLDAVRFAPPLDVAVWFVAGAAGIGVARVPLVLLARRVKRSGAFDDRTAIVGTGLQGLRFAEHIVGQDELALSLVGFFDDVAPSGPQAASLPLPYLGDVAALVSAIRTGTVSKVFVALPWSDEARVRTVVEALSTTPVEIRLAPDQAGFAYARRRVTSMGGLSIITLLERPLSGTQQVLKAAEDRVLAIAALLLLAPLMLLVALAVKATSPGPVLFRQPREGFNCRPFDILKFRTMHTAASGSTEVVQASRRDARVTRIGALLRRTSVDELPQLFNVLLGHMSLVGPRPHAASTRAGGRLFADVAATYAARHKVKPGLTGWAQVCGWRGETTTEEKLIRRLEHDIYYVEHWSIWFDLYILARTAATVAFQRNAF